VRRLFFVIFAPDSQQESSPLSGRKSTQATVRICGASSFYQSPKGLMVPSSSVRELFRDSHFLNRALHGPADRRELLLLPLREV
ncbi:hypothetical protein, partial [Bradyrhizobium sp. Mp27]|uniref:hypothetical protein n=1 Tax=Bradyrhizobium sp. Mp27 TaxID=3042157 RepID=UPI00248B3A7D